MKKYLKPIVAVLIFLLCQLIAGGMSAVYFLVAQSPTAPHQNATELMTAHPEVFARALILSDLLTILVLVAFKFVKCKSLTDTSSINWRWASIAIVGSLCGIFATNLVSEWFELPDLMEKQFEGMSMTASGIIAIAILGPIVEEFTFREAIIGNLLKAKANPWLAVVFSALCFGLIHGNPAQIPFAFVVGLIFGVIYLKTGNIVVTSILHILNNGLAVLGMNIYGDKADDVMFKDALGWADIPLIIMFSAVCIYVLYKFYMNYPSKSIENSETL